jgi:hypothetical protein
MSKRLRCAAGGVLYAAALGLAIFVMVLPEGAHPWGLPAAIAAGLLGIGGLAMGRSA